MPDFGITTVKVIKIVCSLIFLMGEATNVWCQSFTSVLFVGVTINAKTKPKNISAMYLEDEDHDMIHYVMLRAVDRFYGEYNRYPGAEQHMVEEDVPKLKVRIHTHFSFVWL